MGPTRLLAGSHLYATLHELKPEQAVMKVIPAGSVIIAHFDIGHAGTPNSSDRCRYMVKFVAVRTRPPTSPSWNHQNAEWQKPADLQTPDELPVVWRSIWNWMRGAEPLDAIEAPAADALPSFLAGLQSPNQQTRLTSLYGAATSRTSAVDSLIETLIQTAGQDKHKLADPKNMANYGMSTNHLERFFIERQFTPEDVAVALGTMGAPAASSLVELLQHNDPWIRLNAVYALGEMGPETVAPYIDDICHLLDDPEGCVIRVTLDALCALGTFGTIGTIDTKTLTLLHRFLVKDVPNWKDDDTRKLMLEQIRYLSSLALLAWVSNAETTSAEVEAALIDTFEDDNGYPPLIACLALERYGSVEGMRAAIHFLRARCWDSAQNTRSALAGGWTQAHRRATLARLTANDEA
jgi:HEAT repeat protein